MGPVNACLPPASLGAAPWGEAWAGTLVHVNYRVRTARRGRRGSEGDRSRNQAKTGLLLTSPQPGPGRARDHERPRGLCEFRSAGGCKLPSRAGAVISLKCLNNRVNRLEDGCTGLLQGLIEPSHSAVRLCARCCAGHRRERYRGSAPDPRGLGMVGGERRRRVTLTQHGLRMLPCARARAAAVLSRRTRPCHSCGPRGHRAASGGAASSAGRSLEGMTV